MVEVKGKPVVGGSDSLFGGGIPGSIGRGYLGGGSSDTMFSGKIWCRGGDSKKVYPHAENAGDQNKVAFYAKIHT